MLKKIKKLIASHREMKKLQAHQKQLWNDILDIHYMF